MKQVRNPGQWKAGQSGNPAGRKPGSGAVGQLRQSIAERLPEIIATLVEKAMDGDVAAARLLLERTVAPLKAAEAPEPVNLGAGSLTDQGRAVLAAVAAGEVSTSQGAALLGAIGALSRVAEADELSKRLDALEGKTT